MDASVVRFLANLKQKGILCTLDEVNRTNNPIVSGKIVKMLPLVEKSSSQPNDIIIFYLKEVCGCSDFKRKNFKVIFVDKAAQLVNNLGMAAKDYLLFCDPKLTVDVAYKRALDFHNKQLVVGLWSINKIENFYYKRRDSALEKWNQLPNRCEEEELISDIHDTSDMRIFSDEEDDNDISMLENRENLSKTKNSSTAAVNPERSNGQSDHERIAPSSAIITAPISSKSIMSDFVSVLQVASSTKNCSGEDGKKNNKKILDINHYTKLAELEKGTRANVYCIFLKVIKGPTCIDEDKHEILVNVTDDTKRDDFLVLIGARTVDTFNKLQPYCIVRLHRLSVVERNGELNGELNGGDLLVFDKNDINITYGASSTSPLPESHRSRVQELKEWTLENIPSSRTFTTLCELDMKHKKINLNGEVVDIKVFEDPSSVVALRIRDGTKCKIPHHCLLLNIDVWAKVLTNSKICYSESDEIDIIVAEPARNFKMIKIGDSIELYNVEVIVKTEFSKTKKNESIILNMKGTWDNLKCMLSHGNPAQELNNEHTSPTKIPCGNTSLKTSDGREGNIKKRKLFNPDMCVNFESDDSENIDTNNKKQIITTEENPSRKQYKSDTSLEQSDDCFVINPPCKINHNLNESAENNTPSAMVPTEFEKKNPERTVCEVDLLAENVQNSELRNETEENYATAWPQHPSSEPFIILVNLLTTNPMFDDDSSDFDVLSIIKVQCLNCFQISSYHCTKWMHVEGEAPEVVCLKCKAEGRISNVSFLIKFELLLRDQKGDVVAAIILGDHAENFLGYSVTQICSSNEIRLKIKEQIETWKETPLLIQITPVNVEKSKPKYHVTGVKPFS